MAKKSKTIQILKTQGIMSALAYMIDKKAHKGGFYRIMQRAMMFFIIMRLDISHRYDFYRILTKAQICSTNKTFLTYIAPFYPRIKQWLTSKEVRDENVSCPPIAICHYSILTR